MKPLQDELLEPSLPTRTFFALVEATAHLVDVSEKYWQSQSMSGARIRILVEIMKEGGTMLPSVLARKIGVTKANISLLLVPLENDGLLRKTSHPSDGRKTVISITGEGQSILLKHLPENRRHIADKMKVLDEREQNELLALLMKLRRG